MSNTEDDDRMVTLESLDDVKFEVAYGAGKLAKIVRRSLGGDDDDNEDDEEFALPEGELQSVPLLRTNGAALGKIVDFLNHYRKEPMNQINAPLGSNTFDEVVTQEFYRKFVSDENLPDGMLFNILTAANYMEIQPLLDLCCLKVTFKLQGKNAEEVGSWM